MRFLSLLLLLFFISIACHKKEQRSRYVLSEPKFIRVLIDYNLSQGVNNSTVYRKKAQKFKEISITDSIFVRHGITRAQFDSTLEYYAKDPQKLDAIYDQVMNEFTRRSAEIKSKIEKNKQLDSIQGK